MLPFCSWESEPQVLHLNKGWLFSIWFPNIQIGIFSLHEQEWVPLMVPYVLHVGEKETEFHQTLHFGLKHISAGENWTVSETWQNFASEISLLQTNGAAALCPPWWQ